MPNSRGYKNMEKYRAAKKEQRKRNYNKTAIYERSPWTPEQDTKVLNHDITDRELSRQIGHSVQAIQIRRTRLKNG